MSTNDNSINARFCWQTRIRSRVISILSATPTDCLKNKVCLWFVFCGKKIFPQFSIFIFARILVSATNSRLWMFVSCVCKRRWRLGGWSAVKCQKAIFAYVAKRKSLSCTLYTCWNRGIYKKKIDFESLVLRKFRKITAISHPCKRPRTITPSTLHFAGKLAFVHGVISILSATLTDCLKKKKYVCQFVFRDFRFSFPQESSFPRRIPGSEHSHHSGDSASLRQEWSSVVGSDSGCGKQRDRCHSTAAPRRLYTPDRTPCGHLPPAPECLLLPVHQ